MTAASRPARSVLARNLYRPTAPVQSEAWNMTQPYQIPYGKQKLSFTLPDDAHIEWLIPTDIPPAEDVAALVDAALANPVGAVRLEDFAGAQSAVVVISDKTRPIPHAAIIPLLARLEALGIPPQATTLLIATGTHTPMPPEEFSRVLPDDLLARYPVVCHDCDDRDNLVYLGDTSRGNPVWANRLFMDADLRVVVGNIEPHQFMGFSGGVKSAAIGLTARETITRNHARMAESNDLLATYETNPIRMEVEEIGRMMGVHLALNTVLTRDKAVAEVLAGEPLAVMQVGMPRIRELYECVVDEPLDLVITSPGGHPKDINLYQGQKALTPASIVTRDGGTVILAAACPEGTGSADYEQWMEGMTSHEQVLARFTSEPFRLGRHKAFQIARDATRLRIIFLTEMPDAMVHRLLLEPADSLQAAIDAALRDLPARPRIGIIPVANATVTRVAKQPSPVT